MYPIVELPFFVIWPTAPPSGQREKMHINHNKSASIVLQGVLNKMTSLSFSRIHARTRPGEETRHLPSVLLCLQISWKRLSSAKSLCKSPEWSSQRGFSCCSNLLINIILLPFFQNSPIPTSLPEPLTASEVAAKKSMTKARYCLLTWT